MIVVLYHAIGPGIFRYGYLAVDLFFVLSGFIMAMVYESWFSSGVKKEKYTTFMYHRFTRVYPAYFFILLVYLFLFISIGDGEKISHLVSNILLVAPIYASDPIVGPSWSLSVEILMYSMFPLLFFVFTKSKASQVAMIGFIVALYFFIGHDYSEMARGDSSRTNGILDLWQYGTYGMWLRGFCGYFLGVVAFKFLRFSNAISRGGIAMIQYSSILLMLASFFMKNGDFVFVFAITLFIPMLYVNSETLICKFLSTKIIMFLGVISYPLYLVHPMLIMIREKFDLSTRIINSNIFAHISEMSHLSQGMQRHAISLLVLLFVLISSIACAHLVNRYIEKPAIRKLRAIENRRRTESA